MFYYILHHYGNYKRIKGKMFRRESCKNASLWRVLLKMLKFCATTNFYKLSLPKNKLQ